MTRIAKWLRAGLGRASDDDESSSPEWFGHAGIDLRVDAQLGLLRELEGGGYRELFARLRGDPELSPDPGVSSDREGGAKGGAGPELVRNGYFPSPDAELYAAMIVRERPSRIIEVGSGFSTLVARRAVEHAGVGCPIEVIDPEPRLAVDDVADRVERRRVQDSRLAEGRGSVAGRDTAPAVGPGSLLFIDSSHVTEPAGDGPFLYCDLLPSLPPGVLVHVHDIYLPWDYPPVYVRRGYTEQYLLHALLAGSRRFELVAAAYFLSRRHAGSMRAAFGPRVAVADTFQGASFWFRSV